MQVPGKLLNYSGPVNQKVIDHLLKDIRNSGQFSHLHKTTSKRVYAIVVELLENIAKHTPLSLPAGIVINPAISAELASDNIIIRSSNPVTDEKAEKLKSILELVNYIDSSELIGLYEDKIGAKHDENSNGAGLGFILMRLKSGNKIGFTFNRSDAGILIFSVEITVSKNIMRKIFIAQSASSPKVILDPEKSIFEISGESRPPDVRTFYGEIITWFEDYSAYMVKSPRPDDPPVFNFNFEYFNSSSAKYILDICKLMSSVSARGREITVNWHYEEDDLDMLEAGREMSRISKVPFNFILRN